MLRLVFFSIWILFHEHSRITGQQRRGMLFILTPLYIFYPFHRHLDISLAITTDSCPRHIANSSWETFIPERKLHILNTKSNSR